MYSHKLGITEINPSGCRPFLQYPWHADGPLTDSKDDGNKGVSSAVKKEEMDKVNDVYIQYTEELKKNGNMQLGLNVTWILKTRMIALHHRC